MKEDICLFGMKTSGLAPQSSASQSGTILTEADFNYMSSKVSSVLSKMLLLRSLKLTA